MFHDCFKVSSSVFCAFCKVVLIISMGVLMMFLACFEEVGGIFQDCSKVLERTFQKCPIEVSRLFQRNFNNVLKVFLGSFISNFAWHSSKLPKQKEGLLMLVAKQLYELLMSVFIYFNACFWEHFHVRDKG